MPADLSRSMTLAAAAVLAAAGLAACGTGNGTGNDSATAPSAAAPSATDTASSSAGSLMGGAMGSSASAMTSGMGSGMGMASPGGTGTPAAGPHDAADVRFAMMMIPHHTQAVAMADLAPTRANSPGVRSLAAAVKAAQGPEITEMTGWLRGWGAPMASGAMGGMGTTGMMSATEMTGLAKLSGTAFDRAWLTMMSTHHRGAVAMARTELTAGVNPDAKALARSIITSQTAQLTQMKVLLAHLPTH